MRVIHRLGSVHRDVLIVVAPTVSVLLSLAVKIQPDFSDWHKSLRGKSGPVRRQLKNAFTPKSIEFFFIDNVSKLENALEQKILTEFKQGRQPGGQPRAPKYSLNLEIARDSDLKIHSLDLS
jgi:hypothetical protein